MGASPPLGVREVDVGPELDDLVGFLVGVAGGGHGGDTGSQGGHRDMRSHGVSPTGVPVGACVPSPLPQCVEMGGTHPGPPRGSGDPPSDTGTPWSPPQDPLGSNVQRPQVTEGPLGDPLETPWGQRDPPSDTGTPWGHPGDSPGDAGTSWGPVGDRGGGPTWGASRWCCRAPPAPRPHCPCPPAQGCHLRPAPPGDTRGHPGDTKGCPGDTPGTPRATRGRLGTLGDTKEPPGDAPGGTWGCSGTHLGHP